MLNKQSDNLAAHCAAKKQQKGTTVVEFAIAAPVFFLLLFAILDGGRLIFAYGAVAHAAKEATRYTVVRGNEAQLDARRTDAPATAAQINSAMQTRLSALPAITYTINWPLDGNDNPIKDPGTFVTITATHDFVPVTPFLPEITVSNTANNVIYY